jgi:hypothetical protein
MTPEQYEQACRKLVRHGEHSDPGVNSRLPQPVVKPRESKIAKPQVPYDERPKSYYQAQCSFRGLNTAGTKEELQELLLHRDVRKDLEVWRGLSQLQCEKKAYEDEQEVASFEQWFEAATQYLSGSRKDLLYLKITLNNHLRYGDIVRQPADTNGMHP